MIGGTAVTTNEDVLFELGHARVVGSLRARGNPELPYPLHLHDSS
jgi:hypothetical protein